VAHLLTTPAFLFPALYHLANGLALLSLILRDQLHLRLVMAVSMVLQAFYYFALPGGPLLDPLMWKIFTSITSLIMIFLIFRDRMDFGISAELRGLFNKIKVLSAGEFKRLLKPAQKLSGKHDNILVQGELPNTLYYLMSGHALLVKDGIRRQISSGVFLGEIAFLTKSPATATVSIEEDASCLSWSYDALAHVMNKETAIDIAMRGLFNHDLARKVSQSALVTATQPAVNIE
jgi:CRP-like cAMP-binding protein